jgi:hypothetical protein
LLHGLLSGAYTLPHKVRIGSQMDPIPEQLDKYLAGGIMDIANNAIKQTDWLQLHYFRKLDV